MIRPMDFEISTLKNTLQISSFTIAGETFSKSKNSIQTTFIKRWKWNSIQTMQI